MMTILQNLFSQSKPEPELTVHKLFEKQVRLTPNAIAVCDNDNTLTYLQLNEESNKAAHLLIESGVKLGDVVGLCINQSTDLVITLLAILKSGAAYLPLDPSMPMSRREFICKDARVKIIFSRQSLGLSSNDESEVVFIENATSSLKENPSLINEQDEDYLAYVLYTSGSTGEPKGVEICHHSLVNVIQYRIDTILKKKERAVIPLTATLESDASVAQIFTPLCSGGKLIIVENVFELSQSAYFDEITCIGSTPSVVRGFLEHYSFPSSLKVLFLGGENVDEDLCKLIWYETNVSKLINLYGPTEATVHVTYAILFDREKGSSYEKAVNLPITIGKPIKNNNIYILNDDLKQCEVGDPGEIYLTGIGLARSYRNRDFLTKEKFIKIDIQGVYLNAYKTGDLGVLLSHGEVKFLGRNDRQIKVYGCRIELDEIETRLSDHSLVKQCAVEAYDEHSTKSIVAYVVFHKNRELKDSELLRELRQYFRHQLPTNMQPRQYKILESFPLTNSGKIDRRSLSLV